MEDQVRSGRRTPPIAQHSCQQSKFRLHNFHEKLKNDTETSAAEDGGEGRGEFPCGVCEGEVNDDDEAIYCESGCEQWYHRECTGMSKIAYDLLTAEDSAEWVCDKCITSKAIPTVKMVPSKHAKS